MGQFTCSNNRGLVFAAASKNICDDVLMDYVALKAVQSGLELQLEGMGWLWMIMERLKHGNAKLVEIDMLQEDYGACREGVTRGCCLKCSIQGDLPLVVGSGIKMRVVL
ncbi:NAD(P)(+) transhydrogenase (Si-specific) [Sarracenia purpurea var. burkii]